MKKIKKRDWINHKGAAFAAAFLMMIAPLQSVAHDIPSKVPKEANERKNPLPHEETVIKKGKELYTNRCFSCHGSSGKGDGPAAASLGHRLPDLTRVLAGQTDGALLWKIGRGGGAMPSYERTLTEEERWQMIHYLRTLQEPKKGGGQ
jgi:mono/diheme cytochrome c family protein